MKAQRISICMVCLHDIHPGDDIAHENRIGWLHHACKQKLDQPTPASQSFRILPTKTFRQAALENVENVWIDDDWDDGDDGDDYGPDPIDAEDLEGRGW